MLEHESSMRTKIYSVTTLVYRVDTAAHITRLEIFQLPLVYKCVLIVYEWPTQSLFSPSCSTGPNET